jgi:glycosyltransferase involved in cell wall biosynthesis
VGAASVGESAAVPLAKSRRWLEDTLDSRGQSSRRLRLPAASTIQLLTATVLLGRGRLIKILHLITDLDRGGAEYCLKRLTNSIDPGRFSSRIVSILPLGPLGDELRAENIYVDTLNCRTIFDLPRALWQLTRIVRWAQPDILQTWLYHSDILGTLASFSCPQSHLLWNVRNSDLSAEKRFSWKVLTGLLARMSRLPDCIVSNSVSGIEAHTKYGYNARRWIHIPNGWRVADSVPTAALRRKQRQVFGLPNDGILVGLVARLAKQKDFGCFLSGVSLLHNRFPGLKFVLVGKGLTPGMPQFKDALMNPGVQDRLIFLGEQDDVQSLLPALDAVTLTSAYGEGLPNSIGEAMAAGLPVIATNVGDTSRLAAEGNWIVPPKSPEALADAWIALASLEPDARATIGKNNRSWIENYYSIEQMGALYERLYAALVHRQPVENLTRDLEQQTEPQPSVFLR